MRLKKAQNLRTCLEHNEAEKRRRTFVLDTAQVHGNSLILGHYKFIGETTPLVSVSMYKFILNHVLVTVIILSRGPR